MGFALGALVGITPCSKIKYPCSIPDKVFRKFSLESTRPVNSLLQISSFPSKCGQGQQSNSTSHVPVKASGPSWKSHAALGLTRGLHPTWHVSKKRMKHRKRTLVRNVYQYDDLQGDFSYRRSSPPIKGPCEEAPIEQPEYEIKVSKEMMGVFQYVEKVKRARLRELSVTLRQVAGACLVFSFIKGFVTPIVEVFRTDPPNWGKLILFLGAFDAFAISYLAIKAREPLDKLAALATEFSDEDQMMGSIEKEEELMLALALEFLGLFGRLRYLTLVTAVGQLAHIMVALLQMRGIQTKLPEYFANFVASWLGTPWA
ncbi:hypothetical protein R1sor_002205 [Riccia sorocarpa]|uniref:Uncharacterized protein n=1 Tax=Riccia sorocarpa TaxID=122646 RepID=A0ABD3GY44_9MARC